MPAPLLDALAADVGAAAVREAVPADAVGGAVPRLVVAPASEAEVAAVLRRAATSRLVVAVRGGGTKLGWGAPPGRVDVVLSTTRLAGLVSYEPGDFVGVARAGTTMAALGAALDAGSEGGQALMLDPPQDDARATVGGVVAAGASGPLRHRYGAPRDLVIGARFVLGDGTVAKTGGRVVKNVAGYDLAKLLSGSLGALGVLTEVAFRLHPRPAASRTVVLEGPDAARAARFVAGLATGALAAAAVEVAWPDGLVAVRLDGTDGAVDRQAERVAAAGAGVLDDAEAAALWSRLRGRAWEGDGPVAAVGVPPAGLAGLLGLVERVGGRLAARAALVVGEVALPAEPAALGALREGVTALGGYVALRRGAPGVDAAITPPADPVAARLAAAVKARLDPAGTLAARGTA